MSNDNSTLTIDSLRNYIRDELINDPDISIEVDQDLLLSGLLDSLNAMRLALHIEQTGGIEIPPEDMIVENFGTLNQINSYINTRL